MHEVFEQLICPHREVIAVFLLNVYAIVFAGINGNFLKISSVVYFIECFLNAKFYQ